MFPSPAPDKTLPTAGAGRGPELSPTEPGSRKLAVVLSFAGVSVGMSLVPSAIPTMAVMWVSGPNT